MKKKLLSLFLGALAALLLLEAGLRLFGAFEKRASVRRTSPDMQAEILCLGDSFTFGLGASPLQSYPAQLGELINRERRRHIALAAKGFPGENSSEILQKTPDILDTVRPRTAIVLLGVSNLWNLRGFARFQNPREASAAGLYRLKTYKLLRYLSEHLRLEKLGQSDESGLTAQERDRAADYARELDADLQNAGPQQLLRAARANIRAGKQDRAVELLRKAANATPDNADIYAALAEAYQSSSRPLAAEEMFSKAIALQPGRQEFHTGLGRLYAEIEQWEKAAKSFDAALIVEKNDFDIYAAQAEARKRQADALASASGRITPASSKLYALALESFARAVKLAPAEAGSCYSDMADIYLLLGKRDKAVQTLQQGVAASPSYRYNHARLANLYRERGDYDGAVKFFSRHTGGHPIASDIVSAFGSGPQMQRRILDWIAADLRRIIRLCRERGIAVVLMNYPRSFDPGPNGGELNALYAAIAAEQKLPFVDNYAAFEKAIKQDPARREKLLGRDMHCTAAGYKLMAQNIFSALRANKLLPSSR